MKQLIYLVSSSLIACLIIVKQGVAQENLKPFYLQKQDFINQLPQLRNNFGNKKTIPGELELECLVALSFYPELTGTEIKFMFGNLAFTMVSKPKRNTILKDRTKRTYVILIQHAGSSSNNLDWSQLSFNALVGWIGHELGHIVHYTHKSSCGILLTGMKYAVPGYRRKIERFTDQLTIQHNLGFALYEGLDYTVNFSNATPRYKKTQVKYYLHPEEIIQRIRSGQDWVVLFGKTKMERRL